MNTKKKKNIILILQASVGSGHKEAAKAIKNALDQTKGEINQLDYETKIVDMLDFCLIKVDGDKIATQYTGSLAPIQDFFWRYNFTGRINWGGGRIYKYFFPKFLEFFKKLLEEYNVSAAVCTHMIGANVVCGARDKLSLNFPIISVPTDYETEGLWPNKQTDLYCVGSQRMIDTLLARKVPIDKIILTGMPASPEFTLDYDVCKCREDFKLPQDKAIVLIMSGASEPTPYINMRKTLENSISYFSMMDWVYFVFCVGKDKKYKNKLESEIKQHKAKNIRVLSYIDNIAPLMAASDLALCKAGGMTVTECLCSKLPMLLVGKGYAQEHINIDYLTSIGAAYHATTYKEMIQLLVKILSNKHVYQVLQENSNDVRKPDAAFDIGRATLIMSGVNVDKLSNCKVNLTSRAVQAYDIYKDKIDGNDKKTKLKLIDLYIGDAPAHKR